MFMLVDKVDLMVVEVEAIIPITRDGSGGGASDVRIGQNSVYSRLIVAGGGGGGCYADCGFNGIGGYGGGINGANGTGHNTVTGGTKTNGGSR